MARERISDSIYVFTSEMYAQVTAGVILTSAGAILVDTLPFPAESRQIAAFCARVAARGVRYVVLTHYHADHVYGACLFPQADVVAHTLCRERLAEVGAPTLKEARAEEPELADVVLRLPDISFSGGGMGLQLGRQVVRLIHAPGHTRDMVMAYVEEGRVLFAGDAVMPVPAIAEGNVDALRASLAQVASLPIENVVQGHGEVILRGEVQDTVSASLRYLDAVERAVEQAVQSGDGEEALRRTSIESCGLSRIPLNGLVQQIHLENLLALYDRKRRSVG